MRIIFIILMMCQFSLHLSCAHIQQNIKIGNVEKILKAHDTEVECLTFSPDSKILASGTGWDKGEIKLWSPETGEELQSIQTEDKAIKSLDFNADSKIIVSTDDSKLEFRDTTTGRILKKVKSKYENCLIAYSPTKEIIAFLESTRYPSKVSTNISISSALSGKLIRKIVDPEISVTHIAVTNDGKIVIGAGSIAKVGNRYRDKMPYAALRLWSTETGEPINTYSIEKSRIAAIALSPNSKYIAIGFDNMLIHLVSANTGNLIRTIQNAEERSWGNDLRGLNEKMAGLVFSPDSRILASAEGLSIKFWKIYNGDLIKKIDDPDGVLSIAWSPDGMFIAYGSTLSDNRYRLGPPEGYSIKLIKNKLTKKRKIIEKPIIQAPISSEAPENQNWKIEKDDSILTIRACNVSWPCKSICFSPDGKMLASGSGNISIWSMESGESVKEMRAEKHEFTNEITTMAFGKDGKSIVFGGRFMVDLRLWRLDEDTVTGGFADEPYSKVSHNSDITSVAISPDGRYLASGAEDGYAKLWNLNTKAYIRTFQESIMDRTQPNGVNYLAFSPDGSILATTGSTWTKDNEKLWFIRLWSVNTGKLIRNCEKSIEPISSFAFSSDGKTIYTWFFKKSVQIWSVKDGKQIGKIEVAADKGFCYAYNPVRDLIATGCNDGSIEVWSISTGEVIRKFTGHLDKVLKLDFSHDGKLLASSASDGVIKIFSLDPKITKAKKSPAIKKESFEFPKLNSTQFNGWDYEVFKDDSILTIENGVDKVWDIALSPDGTSLAAGGDANNVVFFNIKTGNILNTIEANFRTLRVSYSPDGNIIASGGFDNFIILWSSKSAEKIHKIYSKSGPINDLVFHPNGNYIVTGGKNNIEVWDVKTAELVQTFSNLSQVVKRIVFHPSGNLLAYTGFDSEICLLKFPAGTLIQTFTNGSRFINSLDFNHDGSLLLSGGSSIKVWSISTGKLLNEIQEKNLSTAIFSPNGQTIISGNYENEIKIWTTQKRELIRTLTGHTNDIMSLDISSDGLTLASASRDNTIKVWSLEGIDK